MDDIRDSFKVHTYAAMKMKRHKRVDPAERNGPVQSVKPDPKVWRTALKLAGGDLSRVQVDEDGSVRISN